MIKLDFLRYPIITHAKNVSNPNRLKYLALIKGDKADFYSFIKECQPKVNELFELNRTLPLKHLNVPSTENQVLLTNYAT